MNLEEIKNKLFKELEVEVPEIDFKNIDTTALMMDVYGISSLNIMKIIVCAEDTFGIFFKDSELVTSEYNTFNDIINVVNKKVNG